MLRGRWKFLNPSWETRLSEIEYLIVDRGQLAGTGAKSYQLN